MCTHFKMTPKEKIPNEDRKFQFFEEICDNSRAIRRVVNRILDHMHEYSDNLKNDFDDYDPDAASWDALDDYDDMYL